jgi:hypothetical protein
LLPFPTRQSYLFDKILLPFTPLAPLLPFPTRQSYLFDKILLPFTPLAPLLPFPTRQVTFSPASASRVLKSGGIPRYRPADKFLFAWSGIHFGPHFVTHMTLPVGTVARHFKHDYCNYAILDNDRLWKPCVYSANLEPSNKVLPYVGHKNNFVYTTRNGKTGYFKDGKTAFFNGDLPCKWDILLEQPTILLGTDVDLLLPHNVEWIHNDDLDKRVHIKLVYMGNAIQFFLYPHDRAKLFHFAQTCFRIRDDTFSILLDGKPLTTDLDLPDRATLIVHDAPPGLVKRGRNVFSHHKTCNSNIFTISDLRRRDHHLVAYHDDDDSDYLSDDSDEPRSNKRCKKRGLLMQALQDGTVDTSIYKQGSAIHVNVSFEGIQFEQARILFPDIFSPRMQEHLLKEIANSKKIKKVSN